MVSKAIPSAPLWRAAFSSAQTLDEAYAIELGKHEVHHGSIVSGRLGQDQRLLAVGTMIYGVASLLEPFDNKGRDLVVILDH